MVYLDHQFEEIPTWSSYIINMNALRFWIDDYRDMYISYFKTNGSMISEGYPSYRYKAYEVGSVNALNSGTLTTERVLLCMPNSAYSVNGIIYPSTDLSTIRINGGVTSSSNGIGYIQSIRYRIYGCYILDVFDWRHYMIPCLRVSDGREGLYDLVDGVFTPILYPNIINMSTDGVITSTYPVASDLTVVVSGLSTSLTVVFPKGSSSISVAAGIRNTIKSITPTYDDSYYYIAD